MTNSKNLKNQESDWVWEWDRGWEKEETHGLNCECDHGEFWGVL